MLTTTPDMEELLAEDEQLIAAEEAAERRRLQAVLNADRQMRERLEAEARAKAEGERWRAITGSCSYLDSLPDARKDFLIHVFKRMAKAKPEHAELLERAARYVRPPVHPLLEAVAEVPVHLVQPLTPEQIKAGDKADECKRRIEAKIKAMYERPTVRHLKCGKTRTIHLRRDYQNGAVDDLLIKTKVAELLTALGRKSRTFKNSELQGLIWRSPDETSAFCIDMILATSEGLRPMARPSSSKEKYRSKRGKSDTPPPSDHWGAIDDDWRTPWDYREPGGSIP